jgi:hypothetical protein
MLMMDHNKKSVAVYGYSQCIHLSALLVLRRTEFLLKDFIKQSELTRLTEENEKLTKQVAYRETLRHEVALERENRKTHDKNWNRG